MNANSRDRASTTKRHLVLATSAAMTVLLGACVPPAAQPPRPTHRPAPPTSATPAPPVSRPAPAVAPSPNWRDAPVTAGTWRFASAPEGGRTDFAGLFTMRCLRTDRHVVLNLTGTPGHPPATLTFTSDTRSQTVPARPGMEGLSVVLPAGDPLLDALAFSRGRFKVDASDGRSLVLPSWPEVARVIEDCR